MRLIPALPLLLTGLIAGCAAPGSTDPGSTDPGSSAGTEPQVQTETADDGWRWESFAGIEFQVPETYRWNTSGSPLYPGCVFPGDDEPPVPAVNRGFTINAIGCPPGRPVTTFAPSVDLGSAQVGTVRHGSGWVSETVEVAGVNVTVSDDDAARRERILRSIRPVGEADAHGCPPSTDLVRTGERPSSTPPVAEDVTGVGICRYVVPHPWGEDPPQPLVSSSRLSGAEATDLVRAVLAAPEGTGPNSPEDCATEGDELVVLEVETARGPHEVVVRYSGCDGNGTDDGTTRRTLTSDVLNAVLTGPNQPTDVHMDVGALVDW